VVVFLESFITVGRVAWPLVFDYQPFPDFDPGRPTSAKSFPVRGLRKFSPSSCFLRTVMKAEEELTLYFQ